MAKLWHYDFFLPKHESQPNDGASYRKLIVGVIADNEEQALKLAAKAAKPIWNGGGYSFRVEEV